MADDSTVAEILGDEKTNDVLETHDDGPDTPEWRDDTPTEAIAFSDLFENRVTTEETSE